MVFFVALAGSLWGLNVLALVVGSYLVIRHHAYRTPNHSSTYHWPSVSILVPLRGNDSGLRQNLESLFHLDYPKYEIFFSAADPNDPALGVVFALIRKYSTFSALVVVGDMNAGPNPKINNLLRSYARANFDHLLILDSNVRVYPMYLKNVVSELKPGVGVVTGSVSGRCTEDLAGTIEAIYLNTFFTRWLHLASALGVPLVMGKTMFFRRSVAEKFGGLRSLSCYLAEDFWLGKKMKELDLRIALMHEAIPQHIGSYKFLSFWSRHIRWGRMRKAQAPLPFVGEFFGTTIISGLLGAFVFRYFYGMGMIPFFFWHCCLFAFADLLVASRVGDGGLASNLFAWAIKEILVLPLWVQILSSNCVRWRGNRLVLRSGGTVEAVPLQQEIEPPFFNSDFALSVNHGEVTMELPRQASWLG